MIWIKWPEVYSIKWFWCDSGLECKHCMTNSTDMKTISTNIYVFIDVNDKLGRALAIWQPTNTNILFTKHENKKSKSSCTTEIDMRYIIMVWQPLFRRSDESLVNKTLRQDEARNSMSSLIFLGQSNVTVLGVQIVHVSRYVVGLYKLIRSLYMGNTWENHDMTLNLWNKSWLQKVLCY